MRLRSEDLFRAEVRIPSGAGETLRFASAELCHYLQAMSRVPLAPVRDPSLVRPGVVVGRAPLPETGPLEEGEFRVVLSASGFCVLGGSERAVLHGVYRLLEHWGCRWSFHGSPLEEIPRLTAEGVAVPELREKPAFRVRAYASDIHTWHYSEPEKLRSRLPSDVAFVDWLGKTGANAFLFIHHPFDSAFTIRELEPEFSKRGIGIEWGGHVLPVLLPRERFRDHPEWFPEGPDGRRTDLGNLCPSSPEALAEVADRAWKLATANPRLGALHLWGADFWEGGWCRCAGCKGLSPSEQSLRVCNAVARRLEERGFPHSIYALAYHDTIEPELESAPAERVFCEFAPRERCYAHALSDPSCERNRFYRRALEGYLRIFGPRVRVFEYYGDAILFFGCGVPLVEVIEEDLEFYRTAGVSEVSLLQFGAYSVWAYPLNLLAYAFGTWGRSGELGRSIPRELRAYGPQFWRRFEQAVRPAVAHGDIRRPTGADPKRLAEQLSTASRELAELSRAVPDPDSSEQRELLGYTAAVLRCVAKELEGSAPRPVVEDELGKAISRLAALAPRHVGLWGVFDLPLVHAFFASRKE